MVHGEAAPRAAVDVVVREEDRGRLGPGHDREPAYAGAAGALQRRAQAELREHGCAMRMDELAAKARIRAGAGLEHEDATAAVGERSSG